MKYLLDTHTLLWFLAGNTKLSARAHQLIADSNNEIFISIASLWEIAIKVGLGKLTLRQPFEALFPDQLNLNSIEILPITVEHLIKLIALPLHHRDPFDRVIIAQALVEGIPIIGVDSAFDVYGINREW